MTDSTTITNNYQQLLQSKHVIKTVFKFTISNCYERVCCLLPENWNSNLDVVDYSPMSKHQRKTAYKTADGYRSRQTL